MFDFCTEIAPTRAAVARTVLAAVKDLEKLVAEDRSLASQLDSEELALLNPKPFPEVMISRDLAAWLHACVGKGLIDAAEMSHIQMP
jgi:hypothetical protein